MSGPLIYHGRQSVQQGTAGAAGPPGPPGPSGAGNPWIHVLTAGDIAAGFITLPGAPTVPTEVLCFVAGDTPQRIGIDFAIAGAILSWTGLALDGVLETGDTLQMVYT